MQATTVDKKKALEVINKEIERANHDIKTIQFDIKKCPKDKEKDLQCKYRRRITDLRAARSA